MCEQQNPIEKNVVLYQGVPWELFLLSILRTGKETEAPCVRNFLGLESKSALIFFSKIPLFFFLCVFFWGGGKIIELFCFCHSRLRVWRRATYTHTGGSCRHHQVFFLLFHIRRWIVIVDRARFFDLHLLTPVGLYISLWGLLLCNLNFTATTLCLSLTKQSSNRKEMTLRVVCMEDLMQASPSQFQFPPADKVVVEGSLIAEGRGTPSSDFNPAQQQQPDSSNGQKTGKTFFYLL